MTTTASAGLAETAKTTAKRRGYDFTRPEPSEILPNPTEAVGVPPQMRAYATVKEMASPGGSGKTTKPVRPAPVDIATPPPEPPPGPAPPAPPQRGSAPSPAPASAPAAADNGPPPPSASLITQHVQKTLAGELAARGLGSRLVYHPSPLADTDPDIRAAEERAWSSTVTSLAGSWRAWQATHPVAGPGRRDATSNPPAVLRSPGILLLEGEPAGVTGDLDP